MSRIRIVHGSGLIICPLKEQDWQVILVAGAKTRQWLIGPKLRKKALWIAGVLAGFFVLGLVGVVLSAIMMVQNAQLRSENAQLRDNQKLVLELQQQLAQASQLRQQLQYMLGVGETQITLSPAELPPLTGTRSQNPEPMGLPVIGPITQGFSEEHPGIDIAADSGTPVVATAMGVVQEAGPDSVLGLHVVISHDQDVQTIYGHMSKLLVKKGQTVYGGDIIGFVGSTGVVTGPHLHYAIRHKKEYVNPAPED